MFDITLNSHTSGTSTCTNNTYSCWGIALGTYIIMEIPLISGLRADCTLSGVLDFIQMQYDTFELLSSRTIHNIHSISKQHQSGVANTKFDIMTVRDVVWCMKIAWRSTLRCGIFTIYITIKNNSSCHILICFLQFIEIRKIEDILSVDL